MNPMKKKRNVHVDKIQYYFIANFYEKKLKFILYIIFIIYNNII